MECQHIQEQLFDYVGGELSSKKSKRIREHLETCNTCERKRRQYEETHKALKHFGRAVQTGEIVAQPPPLPEQGGMGLWQKCLNGLTTPIPVWMPSVASLVVLLLFVGVFSFYQQPAIELSHEKGGTPAEVVAPPFAAEMMLEFLISPSPTDAGELAASVETVETFILAHPDDLAMYAKLIELYKAQLKLEALSDEMRASITGKLATTQAQFLRLFDANFVGEASLPR